jgi:hypothetical protein
MMLVLLFHVNSEIDDCFVHDYPLFVLGSISISGDPRLTEFDKWDVVDVS